MQKYHISDRVRNIQVSLIKQMPALAYKLVQEGRWVSEEIYSLGRVYLLCQRLGIL